MADNYFDADSAQRYDVLRVQKNRCDKIYGIVFLFQAAMVLWGVIQICVMLPFIAAGETKHIFTIPVVMLACFFGVWGAYRRNWKLTALAVALWAVRCIIEGDCWLYALGLSSLPFYPHWQWEKLKKEDGFPEFDISRAREQAQVQRTAAIQQDLLEEQARRNAAEGLIMPELTAPAPAEGMRAPQAANPGEMETL